VNGSLDFGLGPVRPQRQPLPGPSESMPGLEPPFFAAGKQRTRGLPFVACSEGQRMWRDGFTSPPPRGRTDFFLGGAPAATTRVDGWAAGGGGGGGAGTKTARLGTGPGGALVMAGPVIKPGAGPRAGGRAPGQMKAPGGGRSAPEGCDALLESYTRGKVRAQPLLAGGATSGLGASATFGDGAAAARLAAGARQVTRTRCGCAEALGVTRGAGCRRQAV